MNNIADDISHAYQDGFNDGVASLAKPFGNGMDVCPVCGKPSTIGKPLTNADRIRAMTDEELAVLCENGCPPGDPCCNRVITVEGEMVKEHCVRCWLDWLKQEVDNG